MRNKTCRLLKKIANKENWSIKKLMKLYVNLSWQDKTKMLYQGKLLNESNN